jgi:hypothetical protein
VSENEKVDSVIAIVQAVDADEGNNAKIRYSILPSSSPTTLTTTPAGNSSDLFTIEATTGRVKVARSLGGRAGVYVAVVAATDAGPEPQSSTVRLVVTVEDVNDHPPVIMHPAQNITIPIMEVRQRCSSLCLSSHVLLVYLTMYIYSIIN